MKQGPEVVRDNQDYEAKPKEPLLREAGPSSEQSARPVRLSQSERYHYEDQIWSALQQSRHDDPRGVGSNIRIPVRRLEEAGGSPDAVANLAEAVQSGARYRENLYVHIAGLSAGLFQQDQEKLCSLLATEMTLNRDALDMGEAIPAGRRPRNAAYRELERAAEAAKAASIILQRCPEIDASRVCGKLRRLCTACRALEESEPSPARYLTSARRTLISVIYRLADREADLPQAALDFTRTEPPASLPAARLTLSDELLEPEAPAEDLKPTFYWRDAPPCREPKDAALKHPLHGNRERDPFRNSRRPPRIRPQRY